MDSFYSNIIEIDPRYNGDARINDIDLLEPITKQAVQNIISDAKAHGIELMVFKTYRSQARQQLLFDRGATHLKNVGVHHYGLACDLVKNIGGEPSWKGDFSLLGVLARAYGLIWGGYWGNPNITHSFIDNVHVQRCSIYKQAALFSVQWYPDNDCDPYDEASNSF